MITINLIMLGTLALTIFIVVMLPVASGYRLSGLGLFIPLTLGSIFGIPLINDIIDELHVRSTNKPKDGENIE